MFPDVTTSSALVGVKQIERHKHSRVTPTSVPMPAGFGSYLPLFDSNQQRLAGPSRQEARSNRDKTSRPLSLMIIRRMISLGSNSFLSFNPYLGAYLSGWTSFGDLPNTWQK